MNNIRGLVRPIVLALVVLGGAGVPLAARAAATLDDLFKAASIDNLRDVRRLIQDGVVDPNAVDARGDTLLIAAIRNDADRVADYLIGSKKVSLDATNSAQETALMLAAYRNKKDLVDKLIAHDAPVNRPGWTALHYAASVGNVDIIRALLQRSATIDALSPNRTTPLMMAARGNHADASRFLVAQGADPSLTNDSELAAADFAFRNNDPELGKWLNEQAVAWRAKGDSGVVRRRP